MIKVLYVIENEFFGGGERAFSQLIRGLDRSKYSIYAAFLPGGLFEERIQGYCRLIKLDLRNRFDIFRIFALADIIRKERIDIIHSQGARADFFSRLASRLAGKSKAVSTVAMPVDGFDVGIFRKSVYTVLDRFTERYADRFITVSDRLKQELNARHKIPENKITRVYNGIEPAEYSFDQGEGARIRKEMGLAQDVRIIGSIGRLVWQKGFIYLLRAVKYLDEQGLLAKANARFIIVGDGPQRKKLEAEAAALGIAKYVLFTGFSRDVKKMLNIMDIMVFPSLKEGQPIALLEAMAMSRPVVATDIPGVNETLINRADGILVRPEDPLELALALETLLKDQQKADAMGLAARKAVEEKFNIRDKIQQYERIYDILTPGRV